MVGTAQNYLLEKSRIVQQHTDERNFHIFYQLLASASDRKLEELNLRRGPAGYKCVPQRVAWLFFPYGLHQNTAPILLLFAHRMEGPNVFTALLSRSVH